jgi:hypothetical protein
MLLKKENKGFVNSLNSEPKMKHQKLAYKKTDEKLILGAFY